MRPYNKPSHALSVLDGSVDLFGCCCWHINVSKDTNLVSRSWKDDPCLARVPTDKLDQHGGGAM